MGRFVLGLLGLVACRYTSPELEGNLDAMPIFDDGGHEIRMWNFDTAAEWGVAGHTALSTTIEPRGSLTPDGYVYGGLIVRGLDGMKLFEHAETGWFAKTQLVTPTGAGFWNGQSLVSSDDLRYAGITGTGPKTLWFEGEIFLTANETRMVRVEANDVAYMDIAQPGTDQFVEFLESSNVAPFTATTTGWHPVRVGYADGDNSGDFRFQLDVGGTLSTIPRNRMRAPAKQLSGMLRTVFFQQIFAGGINGVPPVATIDTRDLAATTAFSPQLQGAQTNDWSVRWSGQVYATIPGTYQLEIVSDDGNQLALAGVTDQDQWSRGGGCATCTSSVSANLVEGWNDLVVDYNQVNGANNMALRIVDAPDTTLEGLPIPGGMLRPVVPRGDRLATESTLRTQSVPDNDANFTNYTITMDGLPGEVVTAVDLTVRYQTNSQDDLVIRLTAPNQPPLVLAQNSGGNGGFNGFRYFRIVNPALIGGALEGNWVFGMADNNGGGNTTSITEVHLTVHTSIGPEQVALASEWRSQILDHETRLFSIDSITWDERMPAGSLVTVHMRSCDQPDCSDAAFGPAITKGTPPELPPRRFMQIQVKMTSDGTREPELRSLMLVYRRDVM